MQAETNAEDICANLEGKVSCEGIPMSMPDANERWSFGLILSRQVVMNHDVVMSRKGVLALKGLARATGSENTQSLRPSSGA